MSGTSFLAPLRFISLLLNLIVITEIFPYTGKSAEFDILVTSPVTNIVVYI